MDHDNDGITDAEDDDDDGDGIDDREEVEDGDPNTNIYDHDNDGISDAVDLDRDNDGIDNYNAVVVMVVAVCTGSAISFVNVEDIVVVVIGVNTIIHAIIIMVTR